MKTILIIESGGMTGAAAFQTLRAQFANAGEAEAVVLFTNDIGIGSDGWAQIAPFGDFLGKAMIPDENGKWRVEKAVQRMDKAAATQMVNEYEASRKGMTRFLKSRPIYEGHPDAPVGGSKYPNNKPIGVFANLECREDGLYAEIVLTEEGEGLLASKKVRAPSTRWSTEYVGEEKGLAVFRPNKLFSVGLVPKSNLPVQMLNEAEFGDEAPVKPENNMNKKLMEKLATWCKALGVTFANDANEEQLGSALDELDKKVVLAVNFANEKATLQSTIATRDGEITTLKTTSATLTTDRETARTQFANERKARVGDLLDSGIKAGLITAADRATWETRLGNEATFANEAEAFKKLTPTVKTASITLLRGDRKVEISNASERREMVTEIVNERMATAKCDYDSAFVWAQKQHPQLFGAMEAPEIKKGGARK